MSWRVHADKTLESVFNILKNQSLGAVKSLNAFTFSYPTLIEIAFFFLSCDFTAPRANRTMTGRSPGSLEGSLSAIDIPFATTLSSYASKSSTTLSIVSSTDSCKIRYWLLVSLISLKSFIQLLSHPIELSRNSDSDSIFICSSCPESSICC